MRKGTAQQKKSTTAVVHRLPNLSVMAPLKKEEIDGLRYWAEKYVEESVEHKKRGIV